MHLLQKFTEFIKKEDLFQSKDKLILAVSGGVDSVVLCELCKRANYNFVIAHCNFQLRDEESERDERFVKSLGEKYGVEVFVKKFETAKIAAEQKRGIQETARGLRYTWFLTLWSEQMEGSTSAKKVENNIAGWHTSDSQQKIYVVTAHHANDNIETLMMNFFKGTGINGLHGILPKQGVGDYLIRPMLSATKEEIKTFAMENDLCVVEDSSNTSDKYTRNFFRNQLLPSIQKVFPQVEENLLDNLQRFKDIEVLYNQSIHLHKKKLLEKKGEEIHIPVLKLSKAEPLGTVIYEIIKDYNFTSSQTGEVIKLLESESGKYIRSSSHRIIKNRNWLIISPVETFYASNILIEEADKIIVFPAGELKMERLLITDYKLQTTNEIASLDGDQVTFPLLLRKWKQGDYFYPLGMQKKKKLSRFFIDQKMSMTEKENTWVIEMNKKIIWVVGKRIDDRFRITASTKNILKLSQY